MARLGQLVLLVAAAVTGAAVGLALFPDRAGGIGSGVTVETIAYVDYVDSYNPGVFTVQADGTHRRLLIAGLEAPAWSPDGRRIAAVDQAITIYDAGGNNGRDLPLGGVCDEPAWSPDGRQIACVGPTDDRLSNVSDKPGLWLENAKTGSEKLLPVSVDWYPSPTWSPDGNRLAFSDPAGVIRILELRSGQLQTLGRGSSPDWSTQGDRIAYSSGRSIVVSRPDGTQRHTVASSKTSSIGHPSWSPDGTRIVYAVFGGKPVKSLGLRVVSADGGQIRILTHSGFDPDWKPR